MNPATLTLYNALPVTVARIVDARCDRFEEALKAVVRPRVEDFLTDCPEAARAILLEELTALEAEYRGGGRTPSAAPDRYELIETIGEGGMGRVSLCRDREMGRQVALKELRPDRPSGPELMRRFEREAQITGRLEHPSIVPVYELVKPTEGRAPFYTMRFVRGHTLSAATDDYHARRRAGHPVALDLLRLLNAFVSVCQAVAYAHSQSVVHRDLKGSNIVLGGYGEVIVLDWGLAKVLGPSGVDECSAGMPEAGAPDHTLQGDVKGTPGYISPEQAAGRVDLIGPRTDVYGLGAILYEILTGRPPFTGSVGDILARVVRDEPAVPHTLVADVPPALEEICLKALSKEPARRPESAGELADEVQRWLAESADRSRARQERERFFNLALDMLCTVGPDGQFKQLNPAWETTLGWSRSELMARPFIDFVHPDDRAETLSESRLILQGAGRRSGPPLENRYRCKDGRYRWVSWTASLIRGEQLVYAVGRDVTERKNAEVALRRSQERFELAVRGSGDGLWDWDHETGESYYSPRWKSMIGYEDHEIPHDIAEWETRLHPDDRARALAALRSCAEGGETAYEVEYRFRHQDGSYRWILDRGVAVRNAAGVTRMAGAHTDITDRKRMEQELRESELRHQAALAEMAAELARCRTAPTDH